jgi:hypothetical protein
MAKKNPRRQPGAGYAEAMGKLLAPDHSTAPAPTPHYPKVGEIVGLDFLPGERFQVIEASDPSLVTVRNDRGATFSVGWRRVVRLEVAL